MVGDVRQRGGQDWADEGVSDVVLVTDELVNNVEEHAAGWLTVDLTWDGEGFSVGVTDPRPTALPLPRRPAPSDRSGRGLMVVSTLCPTWGVLVGPHTKTVWAWVPLTSRGRHPDRAV